MTCSNLSSVFHHPSSSFVSFACGWWRERYTGVASMLTVCSSHAQHPRTRHHHRRCMVVSLVTEGNERSTETERKPIAYLSQVDAESSPKLSRASLRCTVFLEHTLLSPVRMRRIHSEHLHYLDRLISLTCCLCCHSFSIRQSRSQDLHRILLPARTLENNSLGHRIDDERSPEVH